MFYYLFYSAKLNKSIQNRKIKYIISTWFNQNYTIWKFDNMTNSAEVQQLCSNVHAAFQSSDWIYLFNSDFWVLEITRHLSDNLRLLLYGAHIYFVLLKKMQFPFKRKMLLCWDVVIDYQTIKQSLFHAPFLPSNIPSSPTSQKYIRVDFVIAIACQFHIVGKLIISAFIKR